MLIVYQPLCKGLVTQFASVVGAKLKTYETTVFKTQREVKIYGWASILGAAFGLIGVVLFFKGRRKV